MRKVIKNEEPHSPTHPKINKNRNPLQPQDFLEHPHIPTDATNFFEERSAKAKPPTPQHTQTQVFIPASRPHQRNFFIRSLFQTLIFIPTPHFFRPKRVDIFGSKTASWVRKPFIFVKSVIDCILSLDFIDTWMLDWILGSKLVDITMGALLHLKFEIK